MISILKNNVVLFVALVFMLVIKIPHLNLPYSWDEAWSYYPGILKMVENGPSLLTGSIPILDSKGHPLLFYFLQSTWISIFSDEIWVVRLLPLLFSLATVVAIFYSCKIHFSIRAANFTVILFSIQALFLSQASLVLPEVLLTFFLILSLHFFLLNKLGWYAVFASLMVLTKETGLVFAFGFGLFYVLKNLKYLAKKQSVVHILFLFVPLVVFLVHLFLNYRAFGTFFFTEHLDMIDLDGSWVRKVLKSATGILFTMYGRNTMLFVLIVSFVMLAIRREKIKNAGILALLFLQILLLIAFSTINFYTYRYILPAFPLFILLVVVVFMQATRSLKALHFLMFALMLVVQLTITLTKKGGTDIDLGYSEYLPLHKEIVQYCESQDWDDKLFSAEFNMILALRDTFTGYHTEGHRGYSITLIPEVEDADVLILDSTGEWEKIPESLKPNFILVKRFNGKNHWGEIYLRKKL